MQSRPLCLRLTAWGLPLSLIVSACGSESATNSTGKGGSANIGGTNIELREDAMNALLAPAIKKTQTVSARSSCVRSAGPRAGR